MRPRLLAVVAFLSAVGCVNALNDANYHYACNVDADCPSGQFCDGGLCESSTVVPDGGGDAGTDAGMDAGVDAGVSCLTQAWPVTSVSTYGDALITDIVAGDFNHDGLTDIMALDSLGAGLAPLLNMGNGSLARVTRSMILSPFICESIPATALTSADFDGDGWPDVALSYPVADWAGVLYNDQDGGLNPGPLDSFAPGCELYRTGDAGPIDGGFPNVFRPISVSAGDGGFDFVYPDSLDGGVYLLQPGVLEQQGGTCAYGQLGSFSVQPTSVGTFDVNRDGLPDVVSVSPGSLSEIVLSLGQADGSLVDVQEFTGGRGTGDLRFADLNHDGFIDLIYVNTDDNTIGVNFGLDGGFVSTAVSFSTLFDGGGALPVGLVVADFDGDGQLDIATVNGNVDAGTGSITILNGLSDGGFVAVNDFATRLNGPRVIQAADFLDDGGALPWIAVAYSSLTNANVVDVYKSPCAPAP